MIGKGSRGPYGPRSEQLEQASVLQRKSAADLLKECGLTRADVQEIRARVECSG